MRAKHKCPSLRSGQFGGSKKSLPPRKTPRNRQLYVFSCIQKIASQTIRISAALVFLCTSASIDTQSAIRKGFSRGPRLFWPLNCPERSEGQCVKYVDRNSRKYESVIVLKKIFKHKCCFSLNRSLVEHPRRNQRCLGARVHSRACLYICTWALSMIHHKMPAV